MRRAAIQAGAGLSLGYLGQIHMHLLARAAANDRQMVGFARFGLAERALEFAEIACSLRVDRDDELVGSPIPLCFITIAPSTAAGGKKSPPTVSATSATWTAARRLCSPVAAPGLSRST